MIDIESPSMNKNNEESLEDNISAAKAYLLQANGNSGVTMYDHLVSILTKVLDNKPDNAIEMLKEYGQQVKKNRFVPEKDTYQEKQEMSSEVVLAHEQKNLFNRKDIEVPNTVQDTEAEEEERLILPDIMETAFYFEQSGVGLGKEEVFRIFLALKQLTDCYRLKSCRFWGKMLGTRKNYIIAEVEFRDGEDVYQANESQENESESITKHSSNMTEVNRNSATPDEQPITETADDLPINEYKPPIPTPKEPYGDGCNKKIYYACNDAGLSWHRLPPVTPQQIFVSRQIRRFLTGDIEEEVATYPPFPGNEANYLRAMIARISATTHISPQGYYIFEEDDEEEDDDDLEDVARTTFIPNMEFEGIPVSDLADESLSFWVHHSQYILPQGRTTWFNANARNDEEEVEEEEDEDEDREEPDDLEPEEGPPLLTPLSEDADINGIPAWSASKSTGLASQYAIAVIRSNLWPGAHAFATDKKFDNIYIGYGLKYSPENYSPPAPPAAQDEYPSGPDITEAEDPTVEQERALQAAQQEALEAEDDDDEEGESEDFDDDDD